MSTDPRDENIYAGERLRIYTSPTDYQDRRVADIHPWPAGKRPPGRGDHIALNRPVDGATVFEIRLVRRDWARITPAGFDDDTRFRVERLDRIAEGSS